MLVVLRRSSELQGLVRDRRRRTAVSLVHNEQVKLAASYLNSAATGFFAAGVIAPIVAFAFGFAGLGGPVPTLTLVVGIAIFFVISAAAHLAAQRILRRLRP